MKLKDRIKSNSFGLWLAIVTVLIQGAHSAYVFLSLSSFGEVWALVHSTVMALVISGAILFFTLRSRLKLAVFFATFEAMINIAYYVKFIIVEDQSWWILAIAIPVAMILPTTLYYYAEEITDDEEIITLPKKLSLKLTGLDKDTKTYEFENVNENGKQ